MELCGRNTIANYNYNYNFLSFFFSCRKRKRGDKRMEKGVGLGVGRSLIFWLKFDFQKINDGCDRLGLVFNSNKNRIRSE